MRLSAPRRALAALALGLGALTTSAPRAEAQVVDHVNADPAKAWSLFASDETFFVTTIGWSYRPTVNFDLGGIETMFHAAGTDRPVTLELYLGAPGGTLLASGTFDSGDAKRENSWAPRFAGAIFATPVALTANTTYFVGLRNVGALDWTDESTYLGVNFSEDRDRTRLSSVRFGFADDFADAYEQELLDADARYETSPMLRFLGDNVQQPPPPTTVPEPATLGLLGAGVLALGAARYRQRHA